MNKSDLVDAIAESAGLSKADGGRALDGFVNTVTSALQSGDSVSLVGFGTFSVRDRAARTGRNPRTGDKVDVPEKFVVTFKPGKEMEERVRLLEEQAAAEARARAAASGDASSSPSIRTISVRVAVLIVHSPNGFQETLR